jgi:hypothetical protein
MNSQEPQKTKDQKDERFLPQAASLPKGGGAIKRIGETFAANAVTGAVKQHMIGRVSGL